MAGINRLGKAPPRPGSLRAPDRNRNLTLVQYSGKDEEDILKDKDYQRTVRDIEDASQQQGWLFSRGAFDKTDLLYLRDQEEKSRHTEMELHDREVTTYAELRARAERERRTDLRSQPTLPRRDKAKPPGAPKPLLGVVKVKPVAAVKPTAAGKPERPAPVTQQPAKKQRVEAPSAPAAPSKDDSSEVGLPGLIGAYGSDSDDDSDSQDEAVDASAIEPGDGGTASGSLAARRAVDTDSKLRTSRPAAAIHAHGDQAAEEVDYEP